MDRRQFNRKTLLVALASAFSPLSANAASGPFWFLPFWPPGQQKKPKAPSVGNPPGNGTGTMPGAQTGTVATPKNPAASPGNSVTSPSIPANAVNVRTYGAKGDGKTNDTDAFKAASDEINRRGGGVLYIPAGTYIVGKQTFAGATGKAYAYQPQPIIEIKKCTQPVTVMGDAGTKLTAAAGLKFGAFDPVSGQAFTPPSMPFTKSDHLANAYVMVNAHDNADVTIMHLELDGNIQGGRITTTHGRSFYTINSDLTKPMTIKNTIVTHCGVPPHANYVCALNGTYLENVHFKEAFPTKPKSKYRIAIRQSIIGPNVVVDGPVAQAEAAPHVGLLPQGPV